MNKESAKQVLAQSITNLQNRRGQITMADVEAEVINNACLNILKNKDIQNAIMYAQIFTESAQELIPQYSQKESMSALMGIQQNVLWDGMWDFLRDYFQKNHGIQIDDVETEPAIFYSNKHKRYENNSLVSESEVERTINLNFIDNKEILVIGIAPSLSPKKSYKLERNGNSVKYKGDDPDYLFTVTYDDFDEVEQFTLEMPNRGLKIVYFE
ncbi:hypothetical protein [Winogradskyella rapida]|uniref:Uncharacterized protein n=1 Tax=Winogradskyella rapida TaxID=549701 RepID=A0ABW3KPH4_9FLAO